MSAAAGGEAGDGTAQPAGGPLPGAPDGGERRRIVLMRHGSVDYFRDDGTPIPPEGVPLSELGRRQASAAGELFAQCGVRFDRVVASGLARTLETAALALAACGQRGRRSRSSRRCRRSAAGGCRRYRATSSSRRSSARSAAARTTTATQRRRRRASRSVAEGGASSAASRSASCSTACCRRSARLLARDDWHTLLMVLHGGVNRVLLSHALAGGRAFFGGLEQSPACINLIDVPPAGERGRMIVRAVNMAPTSWMHEGERQTTMEKLLAQYMRGLAGR